ncbi:hypothetical protein SAMN05444374_11627 [Rhodococcoides kroppenstedtii]|uniref:Uncharacterized protein n=1 Tax=Rhodococcoides kroppenstedtii TaxID=293050 RepID=A0A1I0U9T5_9NOCA|nr:hypothetical protein [Rhodococcus kroppenstedtii]SFA60801.1 hypothetical protein SAMN05444374_11627 [Rhodococcus kroppenstedtii]
MAFQIDLDAIAAKREEELGSADTFPFVFKGQTWNCKDPNEITDTEKFELQDIAPSDLDGIIDFYLGDQADEFRAAGGGTTQIDKALTAWQEHTRDNLGPTRSGKYSNRMQRRSKPR